MTKGLQDQLAGLTTRLEEANRTMSEFDNNKKRMSSENMELLRQVITNWGFIFIGDRGAHQLLGLYGSHQVFSSTLHFFLL